MSHRSIVVGAGPAGIRCADRLHRAGIDVTVIDENERPGGQIYRQQPTGFKRGYAELYGSEAKRAEALHADAASLVEALDFRFATTVWNIADGQVYTTNGQRQDALCFDSLVVCAGATDRVIPVTNWNTAGVFSLGGAQIALKAQGSAIGRRVVFAGTGPLLYLTAYQYLKAGANVAAVLDTSHWVHRLRALPALLSLASVAFSGVQYVVGLVKGGVKIYTGIQPKEIVRVEQGIQSVRFEKSGGRETVVDCDAVALGYHLRAETQLADLAGCTFGFDDKTRQWLPQIDRDGRSSVSGVYLAGDGVNILGARAAEEAGVLAALAVLKDAGSGIDEGEVQTRRRRVAKYARFADGLKQAFPWPARLAAQLPDDTILCRCEGVTAGELRQSVTKTDGEEINRLKADCRVGMGRCQGRYCADVAAELIAANRNVSLESVGRLRCQAPVKPFTMAAADAHDG